VAEIRALEHNVLLNSSCCVLNYAAESFAQLFSISDKLGAMEFVKVGEQSQACVRARNVRWLVAAKPVLPRATIPC
jgi:hypothetical protein